MKKHSKEKLAFVICYLMLLIVSIMCVYESYKIVNDNDYTEEDVIVTLSPEPITTTAPVKVEVVEKSTEQNLSPNTTAAESANVPQTNNDDYLLAKIAMAEAEGEDLTGKVLVVEVVLNRVKDKHFPDTVYEVITQCNGDTYQFSPVIPGGRWYTTEPNEECWEAVQIALEGRDEATNALYFTSSKEESTWHSRNLEYLFDHGNHKFYK